MADLVQSKMIQARACVCLFVSVWWIRGTENLDRLAVARHTCMLLWVVNRGRLVSSASYSIGGLTAGELGRSIKQIACQGSPRLLTCKPPPISHPSSIPFHMQCSRRVMRWDSGGICRLHAYGSASSSPFLRSINRFNFLCRSLPRDHDDRWSLVFVRVIGPWYKKMYSNN